MNLKYFVRANRSSSALETILAEKEIARDLFKDLQEKNIALLRELAMVDIGGVEGYPEYDDDAIVDFMVQCKDNVDEVLDMVDEKIKMMYQVTNNVSHPVPNQLSNKVRINNRLGFPQEGTSLRLVASRIQGLFTVDNVSPKHEVLVTDKVSINVPED